MNDQIQQLQARIADLEAQLYAIGAGDVARIMREAGMTFHLGLPHKAVVEQMTRVVDLVYAEASIKAAVAFAAPKPAAHQEPVAWRVHPFDHDGVSSVGLYVLTKLKDQKEEWERKGWKVEPLYTAPQPTENLRCKSTQKRLATLWGYEKARQPLTDGKILDLGPGQPNAAWNYESQIYFARAIEEAHGITGGQK